MKLSLHRLAPHAVSGWARYQVRTADDCHVALIAEVHDIDPDTYLRKTAGEYWVQCAACPQLQRQSYESPRAALLAIVEHHNAQVQS